MYVTGLNGTIDVRITSSDVVVLCALILNIMIK